MAIILSPFASPTKEPRPVCSEENGGCLPDIFGQPYLFGDALLIPEKNGKIKVLRQGEEVKNL